MAGREVSLPAILPFPEPMNNYQRMQEDARRRFLTYDPGAYRGKPGVILNEDGISTAFLGETVTISLKTGEIAFPDRKADFRESLCLYDWLCDGSRFAVPGREFAPVSSLPGVLVRGSGLSMDTRDLAYKIEGDADGFSRTCRRMGGRLALGGDLAFEIPVFADLTMVIKFYLGDDEFPPDCVLLWDRNILQYIRYETVYYLAGCLCARLEKGMAEESGAADPEQLFTGEAVTFAYPAEGLDIN